MQPGIISAVVQVLGPNHNIHFFSGVIIELKMMVSGLNYPLGRVKRSDLVQSGRDTSPDVVGGLARAQEG